MVICWWRKCRGKLISMPSSNSSRVHLMLTPFGKAWIHRCPLTQATDKTVGQTELSSRCRTMSLGENHFIKTENGTGNRSVIYPEQSWQCIIKIMVESYGRLRDEVTPMEIFLFLKCRGQSRCVLLKWNLTPVMKKKWFYSMRQKTWWTQIKFWETKVQ